MEKKTTKESGNRPNPRNGLLYRHDHMSSSVAVRGPVSRSFNLEQQNEKSFRRSPSFCERPASQTQKTLEALSSFPSSKSKKNTTTTMRRPKTHPELLNRDQWRHSVLMMNKRVDPEAIISANKLLVNVTVARSTGPLRALLSKDATVEDVIKGTLVIYAKEGRKPLLSNDPTSFSLHYSQFCINGLNPADKVKDLGFRTFFLCWKAGTANESCRVSFQTGETAPSSSCGREIQNILRITEPWYNKLVGCLLGCLLSCLVFKGVQ